MLGGADSKGSKKNAHVYIGALDVFLAVTPFRRVADKEAHGFKAVS